MIKYEGIPISITKEEVVLKCSNGFNARFRYYNQKLFDLLMEARTNETVCEVEIDYGCIIVSVSIKS